MRLAQRLLITNPTGGIQYFVDPVNGSDANLGTSPAQAWKTATKVNAGSSYQGGGLQGGQSVLFKGGTTLTGSVLFRAGVNVASFSATNPIIVGSYGNGDATIRSSNAIYAIQVDGFSGCIVTGLTVSSNNTTCQTGILIQNTVTLSGTSSINIINCLAMGFGQTTSAVGDGYASAEIMICGGGHAIDGNYNNQGTINNINILNCVCRGLNGVTSNDICGISAQGSITGSGYNNCSSNLTNITVAGCTVYNIGGIAGFASGNGIVLAQVQNSVIKYCLAHDCSANNTTCGGAAGQWFYSSIGCTIEYGESYNIRPWPSFSSGCDWEGFNLDGGSQNCTIQYCYSHDNFGPGFLGYVSTEGTGSWNNNTYRFNLSVNDAYGNSDTTFGVIVFGGSGQPSPCNVYVYNNTIVNTTPGMSYGSSGTLTNITNAPRPSCMSGVDNSTYVLGGIIANNIFYQTKDLFNEVTFLDLSSSQTTHMLNNAYYMVNGGSFIVTYAGTQYTTLAAWKAVAPGSEVGAVTGSPGFNNTGTSGIATWTPANLTGPNIWGPTLYALQSGSGYRTAGVNLAAAPYNYNIGTTDYFGNSISTTPNIGADCH